MMIADALAVAWPGSYTSATPCLQCLEISGPDDDKHRRLGPVLLSKPPPCIREELNILFIRDATDVKDHPSLFGNTEPFSQSTICFTFFGRKRSCLDAGLKDFHVRFRYADPLNEYTPVTVGAGDDEVALAIELVYGFLNDDHDRVGQ